MVSVVITSILPIRKSALIRYARSYKFHNLILHISVCKNFSDNCQRNVLGTYSRTRLPFQINGYHTRHVDIISLGQKLFLQVLLRLLPLPWFPELHNGVWLSEPRIILPLFGQHFTGVLMNDRLMRRNISPPYFFAQVRPNM